MSALNDLYGKDDAGEGEDSDSVLTNTDTEEGEDMPDIGVAAFQPMEFQPMTMGPSIEDIMAKSKAVKETEAREEQQLAEISKPEPPPTDLVGEPEEFHDELEPVGVVGDSLAVGTYEERVSPKTKKKKKRKKNRKEAPDPEEENKNDQRVTWSEQLVSFSDDEEEEEEKYEHDHDDREDPYYTPPMELPELETDDDEDHHDQHSHEDPMERMDPQIGSDEEEEKHEERFDDEYKDSDGQYHDDESSDEDQSEEEEKKRKLGILSLFSRKPDKQQATETDSVDISELSPQEDMERQDNDDRSDSSQSKEGSDIEEGRVRELDTLGDRDEDTSGEDSDSENDREKGSTEERGEETGGNETPEPPLYQQQVSGMTGSQLCCTLFCCLIVAFGACIAGSFIGANLAVEDREAEFDLQPTNAPTLRPTSRPTPVPTPLPPPTLFPTIPQPPGSVFDCPEGNSPLEFRITFDAEPGDIGVRVIDEFGVPMWDFPVGAFGSFALLLRENIFTLCLSPFQQYTFEIIDSSENGLVSRLGTDVFGSFSLKYEGLDVTSYDGSCESSADECGAYCRCTYELLANSGGSTGGCRTTDCDVVR
eukprot:scaffold2256_cov166-Amphora_coffeaeformis.AAC.1